MNRWWVRLATLATPHLTRLAGIGLLMITAAAINALKPWPLKILVDNVFAAEPLPGSIAWIAWISGESRLQLTVAFSLATVLIFALGWLAQAAYTYLQTGVALRITYALGARVLEQLQQLSLRFHARRPTGDLVRRVTRDSRCARDLIIDVALPAQSSFITLVAMFAVMLQLDLVMSFVALSIVPLLVAAKTMFYRQMQERALEQHQWEGVMLSHAEEALTAVPMIKAFQQEGASIGRYQQATDSTLAAYFRGLAAQLKFQFCVGGATTLGRAAVLTVGGYRALQGELSVGDLLVFIAYTGMLYDPLDRMANLTGNIAGAESSARRVFEILDADDVSPEPTRADERQVTLPVQGDIVFEDVHFAYENGERVLHGINLHVRPGENIAIVGKTGAGKSTLVSLLLRYFDPDQGRILLDGHDLRSLPLQTLRSQISILLQEPFLLPVSIAENIAYGRPDARLAEVEAAAQAAEAASFIEKLPDDYQTMVGERGSNLSGGEKQRVAIARAMLKSAPILIFDEPTSAVDASTEAALVQAIDRLRAGRTCFIIAHRLSTIRSADRVIVIDQGRIVESGRHEKLMAQSGKYAAMHKLHTGGEQGTTHRA